MFYDLAVGLPSLAFLLFLGWQLQPSLRKLRRSRSLIMATYFGFLWCITILNLFRCILQMARNGTSSTHASAWNALWLLTRFGMIMLEASVVVYLLQGHTASGLKALLNTLAVSGGAALGDMLVKIVYIAGFHVPLFLFNPTGDMAWSKWSFWLMHALVAMLCYAAIVLLPFTPWRELLPAKASFYSYALCLLGLYTTMAVGSILVGSKVVGGYCVYGVGVWLYYSAYPPLVYFTFLQDFFSDEQLDMDLLYYSEMRDAGVFDDAAELS